MNRPHSLDLSFTSSDNQPQGVGVNGYPVQVTYGGWQPNTIWHSSAPRSMANGNWRGPQMSTDQMNAQPSGTNNYSLMPSPLPRAPTSNAGPVSISDCLSGYAYCVKRPDGRYTRLVPADRLPLLNEIPATQASAQGMVLLPDLHMKPPQGVATMNQSVTVKPLTAPASDVLQVIRLSFSSVKYNCCPSEYADLVYQTKIDRIVAISPAQQRSPKVYCDKWIHDGTCAFTQQGCKYKHEMPVDKATQQSLGLFHGFPKWWRDHQEELQKQQKTSPTSRGQAIHQIGWRGDSNDHRAPAPIGAGRQKHPVKGTRDDMTTALEKRPRAGTEPSWVASASSVKALPGSLSSSSTGSIDSAYIRQ
ncbi:uncharacterized protein FIESC28_07207 [Fusarium coffeatum]|uniref:C3H1-type domain-containing protein n=1 Tax=Fusarium coffeatum TaxID=231269 RepID=A0A366RHC2_9HYPO|nr:uncharacterized protein FIESC28_07207 [Fusarium coffeatum]RBR15806.1 hypothetical protein FIESC28_07207 [Fusarium coffeatum]